MEYSDLYVMLIMQSVLMLFTFVAVVKDFNIRKRETGTGVSAQVERGQKSMTALNMMYGATLASCLVLIDASSGVEGHRVILIIMDFLCITYVFYFSSWFRNSVFFPLKHKVSKD